MSLFKYNQKRDFEPTEEPKGNIEKSAAAILLKNKSAISNTTLEELEGNSETKTAVPGEKIILKKGDSTPEAAVFLKPMLAKSTEKPFDNPDWIFENKYDGYRTIAVLNSGEVKLWSRNQISFNNSFKAIIPDLKKIKHTAVLDGEIVVEDKAGNANFQLLQNYLRTGKGKLKYYVFDILNLDGNSTVKLNLLERKELLKMLISKQRLSTVFYSEYTVGNGIKQFVEAVKNQSEGIIAKRADSHYLIDKRSSDWLKIKFAHQEEAIIIGLTEPKKSRQHFGALLLGQYNNEKLQFIGKCGTGFNVETLQELYNSLQPYFTNESPLPEKLSLRDTIQWVEPKLVCQVKFTEWTDDLHLRHPVYLGLRMDKKAAEVFLSSKN